MRTISKAEDFSKIGDPCAGLVTLRGGECHRSP